MTISLDDVLAELSDENRAKVEDGAERIYAEYLSLQELRKAKKVTQVELSRILNKRQSSIAQLEQRSDLMISTLRAYIEGLGGKLTLQVEMPGHTPITLNGLGDTEAPSEAVEEKQQATP
ncbi:helix-turn-helix transcriptional regulator [Roseovarius sp. A21]|uniref:Helix-turn-helix transcriptional regulator n=1 Tax=Roseovarius bejariae TaxID=2576383 RepID=A0A844D5H6_9RHOB|nr:helix-turn-helix transcriptional regulator [Roseovarius bejariae]MRU17073.1 helix-turn-helix transcriptional regulator [Roseovarius bejariae]